MKLLTKIPKQYWLLWLAIVVGIAALIVDRLGSYCYIVPGISPSLISCPAENFANPITILLITWLAGLNIIVQLINLVRVRYCNSFSVVALAIIAIVTCIVAQQFWLAYLLTLLLCIGDVVSLSINWNLPDDQDDFTVATSDFIRKLNHGTLAYTILSLVIAGIAGYTHGDIYHFALVIAMASPCAISIAAPIALTVGQRRYLRHHHANQTTNNISVDHITSQRNYSTQHVAAIALAVDATGQDKLLDSLKRYARQKRIQAAPARSIRQNNNGTFATIDRRRVVVGDYKFLAQNRIPKLPTNIQDKLALLVAVNGQYVGAIYFTDNHPQQLAQQQQIIKHAKHTALWTATAGSLFYLALQVAAATNIVSPTIGLAIRVAIDLVVLLIAHHDDDK